MFPNWIRCHKLGWPHWLFTLDWKGIWTSPVELGQVCLPQTILKSRLSSKAFQTERWVRCLGYQIWWQLDYDDQLSLLVSDFRNQALTSWRTGIPTGWKGHFLSLKAFHWTPENHFWRLLWSFHIMDLVTLKKPPKTWNTNISLF